MTIIHLLGGPQGGRTITTSDSDPKPMWFFEDRSHKIHTYITIRYADVDGCLWWVARHESLDNDQAEHFFTEHFYVPNRLRRNRC